MVGVKLRYVEKEIPVDGNDFKYEIKLKLETGNRELFIRVRDAISKALSGE